MEWLKNLLGEESYNKLVANGTIDTLKVKLGEIEYIANDPKTVIPKHVFNEKLAKIKLLETENEQYKTQLNNYGDMVTSTDMKAKLETQKIEFENMVNEQKKQYELDAENTNKGFLIKNALLSSGADPNFVDMLSQSIKMEDVIVQDGKILNQDKILLPIKDTFKKVFEVRVTGTTPPGNGGTPPPTPTTKQELITKYNEAEKTKDIKSMMNIQRQIKQIEQT